MRVTQVLSKQHIGWHFQNHWHVQGKRKVLKTAAETVLKAKGIKIVDPNQFLKEKVVYERFDIIGPRGPRPQNISPPNWHDRSLFTYEDHNALLEGLNQAKVLTNTVQIQEGLPENYLIKDISRELNRKVKKVIFSAHVFDAEQQKLAKIKDPERPAFNFPRVYGITQNRVFKLLINKLLSLIETSVEPNLVRQRYLAENLYFQYPFERNGDLIQFQLVGDIVLLSEKPLSPITSVNVNEFELPNLFPIKPTVTLNETNSYILETIYPVTMQSSKHHPHTLFINFDKEYVKNLFEEEVTEDQIFGRALLKAFTATASYAKSQFGEDVKKLPSPVTLQTVQTNGRQFHFGVFQLNTLDLDNSEIRNIWYQTPAMSLFDKCAYVLGKPVLEGYNRTVMNHLLAFYNNNN
ncbi:large ribosomal subunit protein mL37 [Euwallacea fornicatus]|uniref:large ribosomal subunit protein mL37 n=1 Tax=Euwallacea fornicatus TaxID=995702 RepID=UPI00338EC513